MTNPWVGLRPFRTSEANLFFGRTREVRILSNLVTTQPTLIVYAPSGTGKSSLINAGLIPVLEQDETHVPVVVAGPRDDILVRISDTLTRLGWRPPPDLDLPDLLEQHWLETDRRTVLIVDQFEERVNAGVSTEELFATMAKLVHSGSDAACVLISVREDYLANLEPLMRRVPGLLTGSYRVPSLSHDALEEAVYGPLEEVDRTVPIEKALVSRSIDDLKERSSGQMEPGEQRFEPGFFQIIWSTLWDERGTTDASGLDLETYERLGTASQILKTFTSRILNELEPVQTAVFWAISRYLVLPTGAKNALTVEDLTKLVQPSDFLFEHRSGGTGEWLGQLPKDTLAKLIRGVLQRLTASGTPILQRAIRLDREEFELLHDLLGHIILEWRDEYAGAMQDAFEEIHESIRKMADLELRRASLAKRPDLIFKQEQVLASVLEHLDNLLGGNVEKSDGEQIEHLVQQVLVWRAVGRSIRYGDSLGWRENGEELVDWLNRNVEKVRYLALEHKDDSMRRQFQRLVARFGLFVDVRQDEYPSQQSETWFSTAIGMAAVVTLSTSSLFLSFLAFRPLLESLDVGYAFLTMGHVLVVMWAGYGLTWVDSVVSSPGKRIMTGLVVPFLESRRTRTLPFTWPLPAMWIQGIAVGVASIFGSLGIAATAGYNEGMLIAIIGMTLWYFFAFDT
jgi:hypothetical protein